VIAQGDHLGASLEWKVMTSARTDVTKRGQRDKALVVMSTDDIVGRVTVVIDGSYPEQSTYRGERYLSTQGWIEVVRWMPEVPHVEPFSTHSLDAGQRDATLDRIIGRIAREMTMVFRVTRGD
jgi:hypothetical protein